MARFLLFFLSLIAGVAVMALGLVVPAHFRATDARVMAAARKDGPSVTEAGLGLARQQQIGAAQWFLAVAQEAGLAGTNELQSQIEQAVKGRPDLLAAGKADPVVEPLLHSPAQQLGNRPVIDYLLVDTTRERALKSLYASTQPVVQRLLALRTLTNTTHFAPVSSAAGKPLEAVITLTALLAQGNYLAAPLGEQVQWLAKEARWGEDVESLELAFLDLLSLGKRMNWGQLTVFLSNINETNTLRTLAGEAAEQEGRLPVLFTAVELGGQPAAVAQYLKEAGPKAMADLEQGLRYGQGGLRVLLASRKPLHQPNESLLAALHLDPMSRLGAQLTARSRWLALALKLVLFFDGAFLLALAGTYLLPAEAPGRRLVSATQLAFTAAVLALMLIWSEPSLLQQRRPVEMPLHWKLPMVEGPVRAAIQKQMTPMMANNLSYFSLAFFLVIQVLIYMVCRRKLTSIQRDPLPGKLKLKVLENEEYLFDAGLYCGFVCTVISLMFISLGVIKPSLMVAYSSTSFGIIFVSIFKIFYLRPYRKQLIMETESAAIEAAATEAAYHAQ